MGGAMLVCGVGWMVLLVDDLGFRAELCSYAVWRQAAILVGVLRFHFGRSYLLAWYCRPSVSWAWRSYGPT